MHMFSYNLNVSPFWLSPFWTVAIPVVTVSACHCFDLLPKSGRNKSKEQIGGCETISAAEAINSAVYFLNDFKMLAKIDLASNKVKYHHSCRSKYLKQAQRENPMNTKEQSVKTKSHAAAFKELQTYISQNLIKCHGAEQLKALHKRYLKLLQDEESMYSSQSLDTKIWTTFHLTKNYQA